MRSNEEAIELRAACFMGLISFLSSRVEALRVSPRNADRLLNAVARTIIQSATITEAPLTAAGLNGTGQVIQVRFLLLHGMHTFSPPRPVKVTGTLPRTTDDAPNPPWLYRCTSRITASFWKKASQNVG